MSAARREPASPGSPGGSAGPPASVESVVDCAAGGTEPPQATRASAATAAVARVIAAKGEAAEAGTKAWRCGCCSVQDGRGRPPGRSLSRGVQEHVPAAAGAEAGGIADAHDQLSGGELPVDVGADVVVRVELWDVQQLLPADAVAASPERTAGPTRRGNVVARFVRRPHDVTAGADCVGRVAGCWKLLIVGLGAVEGDPGNLRSIGNRPTVADVLAAEERAVGKHDAIHDVSGLRVADDHPPTGASIRGTEEARLVVEVAEEREQRVARRIGHQAVGVPVTLEGELHGPGSAAVERLPQPDRRRGDRKSVV